MATSSGNPPKGTLFAIGGGDYEETEPIDRVMLDMAGGRSASVVFVPAASPSRRMGEKFVEYYRSLGAGDVQVVPVYDRQDAFKAENCSQIERADLVFIGWGVGSRLVEVTENTPFLGAMTAAYMRGAIMGCISAGARVVGELSIARGSGLDALRQGLQEDGPLREVTQAPGPLQVINGFNWLPGLGVEVHFGEWNRYGELLLMAAMRPSITWLGVDERTAMVVHPDGRCKVVGVGNVMVTRSAHPDIVVPPGDGKALEAWNVRLDVLSNGSETSLSELRSTR